MELTTILIEVWMINFQLSEFLVAPSDICRQSQCLLVSQWVLIQCYCFNPQVAPGRESVFYFCSDTEQNHCWVPSQLLLFFTLLPVSMHNLTVSALYVTALYLY